VWGAYLNGGVAWTPPTVMPNTEAMVPTWIKNDNLSIDQAVTRTDFNSKASAYFSALVIVKTAIADKTETNVSAAATSADAANGLLADIASDSFLTASEKQATQKEWDIIKSEYTSLLAQGTTYAVATSTYTSYYNALNTYVTALLSSLITTSDIVGATFRTNFKNYYNAKVALLNAITAKVKSLAADYAAAALNSANDNITNNNINLGLTTLDNMAWKSVVTNSDISGTINGSKITVGSITTPILASNFLLTGKILVDSGVAGQVAAGTNIPTGAWSTQVAQFCMINRQYSSSNLSLASVCEKAGNGSAIFGYCSNAGHTGAAVAGNNVSTNVSSYGGFFKANQGDGIHCHTDNPAQWGLYTEDRIHALSYVPFTGSHIVYTNEADPVIGQLVSSIDAWCFNISQTLILVGKTTTTQNKKVVGVVSSELQPLMADIERNPWVSEQLVEGEEWTVKPEYRPYIDMLVEGEYQQICINALGEGGILVCSENGDVENGDYLCSSNLPGYAMRQDDDLLHNYTVGKALEAVIWADEEGATTKLIACTYHCG